jgi:hypothetical protein
LSQRYPNNEEIKLVLSNLKEGSNPFENAESPVDENPENREELPIDEGEPSESTDEITE